MLAFIPPPVRVLPAILALGVANATEVVPLKVEVLASIEGRSREWDWWQARTAYVPGESPLWITTMSETGRRGTFPL